ncbi:hypothetical protein PT285_04360 [Lactobacillus sp. ESL0791]|uniref:hypothetical protein n=1 Tax=Lactobacillus sp. ESL0791 TaxID=2983234 RepID=UPI0023F8E8B9|nr:hypothetical protein [Lactobacillus sp. ESL0791]MDF7638632.1 hypothetical protein [Lactobacillus sp. ESL0791]
MKFLLELTQEKEYGQIPVVGPKGKLQYTIRGNLDNPNHTLYLYTKDNQEIGRLYPDGNGIFESFTIDVINHSLVKVKKLNSWGTNLFYITRLNYLVTGSIKKGTYTFRSGVKNVANVKTVINKTGVVLTCNIKRPEDIPFILLITTLFTQWHTTPLRLPQFPPLGKNYRVKLT